MSVTQRGEGVNRRYYINSRWDILVMLRHLKFPMFGKKCISCGKRLHFWNIGGITPINKRWELMCRNVECIEEVLSELMKVEVEKHTMGHTTRWEGNQIDDSTVQ